MFPNLLDLELGWLDKDETRHLPHIFPLVLSPALSNITLTLENTSHTKMALSSLALSYNSLTFIYSVENDSGLVQEFSTLLLKCTPHRLLRFIVDAPVTWAAFLHASQLPCLQYFGAEGVQVDQPDPPLPATMFHSLKFLAIWGLSANSIWLQTFGRICSTNLELLLLELKDPCDARMAVHLKALENIRHCCHRTLTDLFIMCKDQFSGLEVDRRLVQILLPFTQLTLLHISFTCGQGQCSHKLSDEDLERLVKAMPNLSELVLGGRILCPIPANNSIKSLVAIAKHCKHLEELTIHTNVEAIISGPPPEEYPIPRDQNSVRCPLHSITFGPCSIPNGEQGVRMFVSVLEGLFPNLLMVGASPTTSQWRLVRAKIFAAAGSVTSDPLGESIGFPECEFLLIVRRRRRRSCDFRLTHLVAIY